jgi:bifunctional UDP-N-acetylglucosamine pyrophosphorylase/glucosamine-1-phosphate N-acetyltransferase
MRSGVTIVNSATTFIDDDVVIEPDTVVHPFSVIARGSWIAAGCSIGPGSHILASQIGARSRVLSSTIEDSTVGEDVTIGPYAHLRHGATIGDRAELGNYAEVKASVVGSGTKMHHFGYLGDAQVGTEVNIGAGTITCNYDGRTKHRTVIEDGAFIGSDTMLRAPVTVGRGAVTGAGSVVIRNVAAGSTVAGVPAKEIGPPAPEEEQAGA